MPESYYWFNPPPHTVFFLALILIGALWTSCLADPSFAGTLWWKNTAGGNVLNVELPPCLHCAWIYADTTTHNTLIWSRNNVNGSYLMLSWCWLTTKQVWSWKIWKKRGSVSWSRVTYDANTLVSHWAWCSFSSVFVDFDCYSTTTTAVLPIRTNAASAVWSQEGSAIKMWWWVSPSWPNTEGRFHPVTSSQHFWLSAPWHIDHDAQLHTNIFNRTLNTFQNNCISSRTLLGKYRPFVFFPARIIKNVFFKDFFRLFKTSTLFLEYFQSSAEFSMFFKV